ncbi:MAG: L-threonylcarbamoyladenylate synthase [Rickettsiales bacterium]|jgi:L-threonylcarbamoyladenylate synthase|nr:L-threonylcarbamoyladenylate synthase [Rickettsiales bacterium]
MAEVIRELNDYALKKIVRVIDDGGVVAFPTETVYALAADAGNPQAVEKIYEVKRRANDKPLPVLVGDVYQAKRIVEFDDRAKKLALILFPGPITIVLKTKIHSNLAKNVNQAIGTVGIRMPNSIPALKILQAVGRPLVGTSANISNTQSAVDAYQVLAEFDNKIDIVIDKGATEIGIASTIVDLTTEDTKILREGAIPSQRILDILSIR